MATEYDNPRQDNWVNYQQPSDANSVSDVMRGLSSLAAPMSRGVQRRQENQMEAYGLALEGTKAYDRETKRINDLRAQILQESQERMLRDRALDAAETSRLTQNLSSVLSSVFSPNSPMDKQRVGMDMIEDQLRGNARVLEARSTLFEAANQLQDATQIQSQKESDFILQPLMSQLTTFAGSENWAGMYAARRQVLEHPMYQNASETKRMMSELDQGLKNWGFEISSDGRELSFHDVIRMTGSSDPAEVKEAFRALALRSENADGFLSSLPDYAFGNRGPVFRAELTSFVRDNPRVSVDDLTRYKELENQYISKMTAQFDNDPVLAAQMIGSDATKKALSKMRQGVLAKRGSLLSDSLPSIDSTSMAVDDRGIDDLTEYVKVKGTRSLGTWVQELGSRASQGVQGLTGRNATESVMSNSALQPFVGRSPAEAGLPAQDSGAWGEIGLLASTAVFVKTPASFVEKELLSKGVPKDLAESVGDLRRLKISPKLIKSYSDAIGTANEASSFSSLKDAIRAAGNKSEAAKTIAEKTLGVFEKGAFNRGTLTSLSGGLGRRVGGTLLRAVPRLATRAIPVAGAAFELGRAGFAQMEINEMNSAIDRIAQDLKSKRTRVISAAMAPVNSSSRALLPKMMDDLARTAESYNTLSARMGADVVIDLPNLFGKAQYASLFARLIETSANSPGSAAGLENIPTPGSGIVTSGLLGGGAMGTMSPRNQPVSGFQTFPAGNLGAAQSPMTSQSALSQFGTPAPTTP